MCVCCGSSRTESFDGYFFPFISVRAFGVERKETCLLHCKDCDFYYSEFRPTPEQMERIYIGYRNEEYQKQRQSFEPGYTVEFNASLGGEVEARDRKDGIFAMVNKYCPPEEITYILDYGGDHGQFFPEQYEHAQRYVYDISDMELVQGVNRLTSIDELGSYQWNLILCCHVLEHLSYPREEVKKIFGIMPVGGFLYVEVPYEDYFFPYLEKNEAVPVHEHINFFNEKSLYALFNALSIAVLEVEKCDSVIRLLAVKIKREDMLYKYMASHLYNFKIGLKNDIEKYLNESLIKNVNSNMIKFFKDETDKALINQYIDLKNEINQYKSEIKNYINRYPKWFINLLACFIPKRKNRKHLREKYSRD